MTRRSVPDAVAALGPALNSRAGIRVLVAAITVLGALGWVIAGWSDRLETTRQQELSARNLARLMQGHAERTVESASLILFQAAKLVERAGNDPAALAGNRAVFDELTQIAGLIPNINSVWILDAQGQLVASSNAFPVPNVTSSERDYFQAHRPGSSLFVGGLFVGEPITSKLDHQRQFTLSHALRDENGTFLGVVAARSRVDAFLDFYSGLDLGPRSIVEIFKRDGTILVRYPEDQAVNAFTALPLLQRDIAQAPSGLYRDTGRQAEGGRRMVAYAQIASLPLYVAAQVGEEDVLLPWRARQWQNGLLAAAGLATILLLTTLVLKRMRQGEHAQIALEQANQSLALTAGTLQAREEDLRGVLEAISELVVTVDSNGNVREANPSAQRLLGFSPEELAGRNVTLFAPDPQPLLQASGNAPVRLDGRRKDGTELALEAWVAALVRNGETLFTAIIHDVTERACEEAKILHMAHHDPLTGLPNRNLLEDRIAQAMARGRRNDRRLALLFVDLDNFKPVNDDHGHDVGDEVLRVVADRLSANVRTSDTVARLGGDEFVVMIENLESHDEAATVAQKIVSAVEAPIPFKDLSVLIGASIGIAVAPDDGDTVEDILKSADNAMYGVKKGGRNGWRFLNAAPGTLPTTSRHRSAFI